MGHHWKYEANLPGGLQHSIQVQTDSDTADFNLLVLTPSGDVLAADRGPESGAQCVLETAARQKVVFVVELMSGSGSFSLQVSSQPLGLQIGSTSPKRSPSQKRRPVPQAAATPEATNTASGGETGSDLTAVEAQELLQAHNNWRTRYGVAPLQWSTELAAFAQDWADELEAAGMQMRHRSPNQFGENLYWCSGKAASATEVVDAWGNEDKLYDYDANNWWPEAGHFSQLVWHNTTAVGGAVARRPGVVGLQL